MKLGRFIQSELNRVLELWEEEVEAMVVETDEALSERHNRAREVLQRIARKMEQEPYGQAQLTASTIDQSASRRGWIATVDIAAEFGLLRSIVARLWSQSGDVSQLGNLDEIIRFNELLDHILSESLANYAVMKRRQDRLFRSMLSSLPDPSYVLDLDGRFIYANQAMADLCNTPVEALAGKNFADLGLPIQDHINSQREHVVSAKERLRGEIEIELPEGEQRYYEYIAVPVIDKQGQVEAIAVSARDCTERRSSEAQVWHSANYDLLTDLPNRRLFRDRLDQHFKHSERTGAPFALLFIDLDHFKHINDLLGHDAGDLLLKMSAERLTCCVRETDTVARMGGDEFTIILLDIESPQQIEEIARSILKELAKPFYLGEQKSHISSSIGISQFPRDAKDPQQLVKNADQAMYLAKKGGRNRFCRFEQIMEEAASARLQIIVELREALRSSQLHLFYQPIIDLADGRIAKAEALLRWAHPEKGLLLPGDFLEVAEETGIINDIENWAFVEATTCSKHWGPLTAPSFQINLNTSPVQFRHHSPEIPWRAHLNKLGLAGSTIAMELPEKVLLHGSKVLTDRLCRLQEAGIQLAMDDFGTGYTSMVRLRRFNVCFLKIDRAIVRDLVDSNHTSETIAEAMILMAHKLGLKVIAEGVETQEQRHCLTRLGCDYAQGYFFSEPLPAEEFEGLLRTGYVAA